MVVTFIKLAKFWVVSVMNFYEIYKFNSVVCVEGLINAAHYKVPRAFLWAGERHDFWEMVYVDKGELEVIAGADNYILKVGELAFHCPNEFHNLRAHSCNSCNIFIFAFVCCAPMMKALERQILTLGIEEKQCLASLVKESAGAYAHFNNTPVPLVDMQQIENRPFGSQQMIKNLLEYLLVLIYRRNDGVRFDARAVPTNQLHHHVQIVERACEYMSENYGEKISLEQLAAQQCISVSQLKRIFKEQTGFSVITYLTNLRISEAKSLIRESHLNFSQIAVAVGYDNIYYFSSTFKKHTGMTPTEYSKSLMR